MVVTLALLVLLTVTLVAFFSRATANQRSENSAIAGELAELLADSALDIIVGDLRAEIMAGSTASTTNNVTIFEPVDSTRVRPIDAYNNSIPVFSLTNGDFANLVKQSVPGQSIFGKGTGLDTTKAAPVIQTSSPTRTDVLAKSGRAILPSRWNAPMLVGGNGFAPDQVPYWVLITRDGVATDQSKTDGVIGRFSFNVYDVGGLLDANVAGFAPTASGKIPEDMAKKGGATWADLRVLPGLNPAAFQNEKTWLPKWRNTGDWSEFTQSLPLSTYLSYHESGWLAPLLGVGQSDSAFSNRQDLIRYARANPLMFSSPDANRQRLPALQYLTAFSRDVNAPAFTPHPDRPKIKAIAAGGNDGTGSGDLINPSLVHVRVVNQFTRDDGSIALSGAPLIHKRFPLMRLAKITLTATGAANATSEIYRHFGLSREKANHPWGYNHGANAILKLGEVASRGREPDFVELLKAAVIAGSLGKASGQLKVVYFGGNDPFLVDDDFRNSWDRSVNYQIIQMAANIIDQFDADGWPTRIRFDNRDFYGIENLPYISAIRTAQALLPPVVPAPPDPTPQLAVFYQTQLWNPHNPLNLPPAGQRPTKFRVVANGSGELSMFMRPNAASPAKLYRSPFNLTNAGIQFDTPVSSSPSTQDNQLLQPAYLRLGFGTPTSNNQGLITDVDGKSYLGISLGSVSCPDPSSPLLQTAGIGLRVRVLSPGLSFDLQYEHPTSGWLTYDRLRDFSGDYTWASAPLKTFLTRFRTDPRTNRFGTFGGLNDGPGDLNTTNSERDGIAWPHDLPGSLPRNPEIANTIWPTLDFVTNGNTAGGAATIHNSPNIGLGRWSHLMFATALGWKAGKIVGPPPDYGAWPGTLSRNIEETDYLRYTDADGQLRGADGAFANMTTGDGLPLLNDNLPSRPIILNRPFQSVAELGYVFRDTPWKSIDFFTKESGDAALLEVFCVHESPKDAVTAGRVNLNTRQWQVLKALLTGAAVLEDGSVALTDSEAESLAKALVKRTSSSEPTKGPLITRSDLVGRYTGSEYIGFSEDVGQAFTGPEAERNSAIKARREAPLRAFAEAGSTRNWNFLIDVIAQHGRFPASNASTDNFMVAGESRVWLHVAIDRWTGKIIGRTQELVQ